MKIDKENLLDSILDNITRTQSVRIGDIPNIPLYMDQVTTLMNEKLEKSKRYEDDKILTKTMINNYAKNNLLPPPVKKKYEKEHVLVLIFISYFKNILSIRDIEKLLEPITTNYFSHDDSFNICNIYDEVFHIEREYIEYLKVDVKQAFELSEKCFEGTDNPDERFLQIFSYICILSFDVYVKKQIIEELIDIL